ncbi:MAG: YqgE/AlgH family protein [Methylococcales bacterium]|nr:YqgE/AlgH family protein [Methylococcales bacterium]
MKQNIYLNNQFIIAMPGLTEPNFSHTVTYLCQHNEEGALGIVINRSANMHLGEVFKQMDISVTSTQAMNTKVFAGGPVQKDRGFVLHTACGKWDVSMKISDKISLTTSRDIIEAIANDKGPENYLVALGYAGWGSGQIEQEILENSWLNIPYSENILFESPINQRWEHAAKQIGIDINLLTNQAGHC